MGLFEAKQVQNPAVSPEVADCDRQLAELAQRKREIVVNIGQLYVDNNDSASAAGTVFEEPLKEIEKIAENTETLEKRRLALQGMRKCEKCGNILVLDSAFCNKCGEKLEALFSPTKQNPYICSKCGTPHVEGAAFCTGCGSKL